MADPNPCPRCGADMTGDVTWPVDGVEVCTMCWEKYTGELWWEEAVPMANAVQEMIHG